MSRTPAQDGTPPDLPGYRFIQHIGAGGNAQVYLYEQDLPLRKVAVKVLNESAQSESARGRFRAEANVTADLAHRHIVQVFEANVTADGRPYLVMPYYPQPNLSVRSRREHFSVAEVLRTGIQVGSAVETSHRHDVLHRDIKPQNILTDGYGEPALTDFGIATTKGDEGPEGLSVPWSPPEILYGTAPGDQRSDVYSLGATLWHLLVGRSPFEMPGGDNSTYALMGRIKSAPVPRTQRADVPDSLERLLRQSMAKDLAARPQTAMELIHGLQSIEQELRLPLTQPILAAAGPPAGEPPRGDTQVRPPMPSGETTFRPGAGPLDTRPPADLAGTPWVPGYTDPRLRHGAPSRDATRTNSGQPPSGASPFGSAGAWPASGDIDAPTRARGPVRLDPRSSAASADEHATRARGPVRLDPWAAAADAGPRLRQFPPEAPEAATMARSAVGRHGAGPDPFGAGAPGAAMLGAGPYGHPGPAPSGLAGSAGTGVAEVPGKSRSRGTLAFISGSVLLAIVAGVAVLALGHGAGTPSPAPTAGGQDTQAGSAQDAVGPAVTVPVMLAPRRVSRTQVLFSWTYDNHAPGDNFPWKGVAGVAAGTRGVAYVSRLPLTVAAGQTACIQVEVLREKGEVSQPATSCWAQG